MKNNTYSLPIGSLLMQGKYRIVSVLGQGGFGITYKGEHTILGTSVAIKEFFMKGSCERDEGSTHVTTSQSNKELADRFRMKFIKEAKTLASLKHPGIIRVFDIFEDNGTAYYVMDFIDGKNLNDIVKSSGHLQENAALKYIRQVAEALDYVHQKKLLHLDVKPANILVDKNTGHAILIDFGVSKQYDEAGQQTSTTPPAISRGYSPVEQYAQGNNISSFSPATDIYSLAATLYKLVTGNTPPESNLLLSEEEQLPPYPAGVSQTTRNAIAQCLQTRKKRPQSISEFLTLLGDEPQEEKNVKEDENTIIIDNNNSASSGKKQPTTDPIIVTPDKPKKDNLNMIMMIGGGILFLVIIGLLLKKCNSSSTDNGFDEEYMDSTVSDEELADTAAWDDAMDSCAVEGAYDDTYDNTSYEAPKDLGNDITEGSEDYESGSKFIGKFKNGVRLKGTFKFADGDRFEGDFKEGKMYNGIYYYADGDKFIGKFNSEEDRQTGVYQWANGNRFEGDFKNGKISHGIFYYNNGNKFSGNFNSKEEKSLGVFYWTSGDRYEGEFQNDAMHGSGVYYWADGTQYKGDWKNDKQNGYGIQYNPDGSVWFSGKWENGNPVR